MKNLNAIVQEICSSRSFNCLTLGLHIWQCMHLTLGTLTWLFKSMQQQKLALYNLSWVWHEELEHANVQEICRSLNCCWVWWFARLVMSLAWRTWTRECPRHLLQQKLELVGLVLHVWCWAWCGVWYVFQSCVVINCCKNLNTNPFPWISVFWCLVFLLPSCNLQNDELLIMPEWSNTQFVLKRSGSRWCVVHVVLVFLLVFAIVKMFALQSSYSWLRSLSRH